LYKISKTYKNKIQESIEKTTIQAIIHATMVPNIFYWVHSYDGTLWRIPSPKQINEVEAKTGVGCTILHSYIQTTPLACFELRNDYGKPVKKDESWSVIAS
jgi:hypothetical protein